MPVLVTTTLHLPHTKYNAKVRHVACANETPFGVTKFCEHAIWDDMPKIACVQQEYNILTQNRVEFGESERWDRAKRVDSHFS